MQKVRDFQDWLGAINASYAIQRLSSGEVMFVLTSGTISTVSTRPTLVEAAEDCVTRFNATATKKTRV